MDEVERATAIARIVQDFAKTHEHLDTPDVIQAMLDMAWRAGYETGRERAYESRSR